MHVYGCVCALSRQTILGRVWANSLKHASSILGVGVGWSVERALVPCLLGVPAAVVERRPLCRAAVDVQDGALIVDGAREERNAV